MLIKRSDVPAYLQNGAFFASLDEDDQIEFEVPDDCFKNNHQIHSATDLQHLLRTTRFWGVDNVATLIFPFMFHNSLDETFLMELCASFSEYQRMLSGISRVKTAQPNSVIIPAIYDRFSVLIVKFLFEHEGYVLRASACQAAIHTRDLPLLKYLHEQNCPWDSETTVAAINSQNADVLQFVCANGCPLPEHAMFVAAIIGNVDAMTYLHNSMDVAYPSELWLNLYSLPAIQHLRTVGCAWNNSCCEEFAMQGKLECLKYAHENGCPWDEKVCSTAACYGHLHCLKSLHEQGCPWTELTIINAAQCGWNV